MWVLTRKCDEKTVGDKIISSSPEHSDALNVNIFIHDACRSSLLESDAGEPSPRFMR
jgi:hypothetical protein